MATYLWKCVACGSRAESQRPDQLVIAGQCCTFMCFKRDYQGEAFGIGTGVRVSRTGTDHEMGELFLPGNDEFITPSDPDGTKGMREWHETHAPKETEGDRSLVPGRIDKRSF